ncbi:hypothetical protein Vretimale_4805 [Volvox reticuliferus]|uniref:Uncharacterized protein n=1 Tax=Volvox reticuliferus TaxID=1737510 RepID=A0A8J4FGZ6_9CHLO|nr:hypothetical protein Vretifemale_4186 [Volvox reticuliferus]GIL99837.1 hypothetical protein Vretimale_4805 [Volvox reticuliferus]
MTSVLASQLQALAQLRQPALPSVIKKGKPSLLYDFQKAADVDLQTIYDVACQGFEELTQLEPRFRPYRESLFSRASLDVNPDMQTVEFLSKLGESIHGFCCVLSNHFLLPGSFKVLEYLIRRYRANERYVDSLMTAALPYHSTNEFVRLVQVLALGAPGSLWGWLAKMQTSGASLPRDLLAQRCVNDRQLLLFICKAAGQLGGAAAPGTPVLQVHSRTFLSFYAVLLCEVLAILPEVGEDLLAALLPTLLEGLGKGVAQDYRAATLMVLAELFSRATLGRDLIKVVLNTMLKHTEPVPGHVCTVLLVMAHLAVTQQHIRSLPDKTLKYFAALPNVVSELAILAQRGNINIGPLLILLVRSFVALLVSDRAAGGSLERLGEGELLALAHSGALHGDPGRVLASALLEAGSAVKDDSAVRESCQKILRVMDQRYPNATDAAVNAFLEPLRTQSEQNLEAVCRHAADGKHKRHKTHSKGGDKEASDDEDNDDDATEAADAVVAGLSLEDRARFDFVRATFVPGSYSAPCSGSMQTLSAALIAPQAAVRRMALMQLDSELAGHAAAYKGNAGLGADAIDNAPISESRNALIAAALSRLRDDDLSVVVAVLGLSCLKELAPAALLEALVPLVNHLGEFLYGSAKLPQLKAARKAVRKVIGLLRHVGSVSKELRQSAALHILGIILPSRRDPKIAMEAARAAARLGMPLFAELRKAMDDVEAQLKDLEPDVNCSADKGDAHAAAGGSSKKAHRDKRASRESKCRVAVAVERSIVQVLVKALMAEPSTFSRIIVQLTSASAAAVTSHGAAGEAAAKRVQHLLLLVSHAAAMKASVSGDLASTALQLLRHVVGLAELLLPSVQFQGVRDHDWSSKFSERISDDGLPTDNHSQALIGDGSSHGILVFGVLQAGLARLPEATGDAGADAIAGPTTTKRILGLLASSGCSPAGLGNLPLLVVTRSVPAAVRSSFLSDIYAAPPSGPESSSVPLQCLALHIQAKLATVGNTGAWLVMLLSALGSPEVMVRSAACDCLRAVAVRQPDNAAAPASATGLSESAASQLCSALLAHSYLLCREPDGISLLLRSALHGSINDKDGDVAMKEAETLLLPVDAAAEVPSYLVSSLRNLGVEAAGVNTACVVLACLTPKGDPAVTAVGSDVFTAGTDYLARLTMRLKGNPASATALDARAVEHLIHLLFTPMSVAAAIARRDEVGLGRLAEVAELLPSSAVLTQQAVSALASSRLAAMRQMSSELFAVLPNDGLHIRECFAVLLSRYEGDPDEKARAAARTALETMPLSAEVLVPLLNPPAATALAAVDPTSAADTEHGRKKKRKKLEDAPVGNIVIGAEAAAAPFDLAALGDAVAVLELLQWRTGITSPYLLVNACQSLLRRLKPIMGSIASVLVADDDKAAEEDGAATTSGMPSLAGYASTLALQALTLLARADATVGDAQFDLELAVLMAREAPDAAIRNAALGLLIVLANRMPEAALSHVLQVLALVNQSTALQDDEYSRVVGAKALAALVPAWVASGRRAEALWEQVVSSLLSLPPHRRFDVLLALLRALPSVEEGLSDGLLVLLQHAADFPVKAPSSKTAATEGMPQLTEVPQADGNIGSGEPSSSEWLLNLASQMALQVGLPTRLACFARVMEMALTKSDQKPHKALPQTVVAFVTAQLKLKVAVASASASLRRPEPNPALDLGCRRLMEAALAQMQLLQPDAIAGVAPQSSKPRSAGVRAVHAASRAFHRLFAALQGVMAADTYLQSLLTLAEHPADKVKRRALKLFADKIRGLRAAIEDHMELPERVRGAKLWQAGDVAMRACTTLPPLLQPSSGASPLTRQLALVALAAIAAEFGVKYAELLTCMPAILEATKDSHASVRASALATVAAFVRALGPRLVPVLPATVVSAVAAANLLWPRLARAGGSASDGADLQLPGAEAVGDESSDDQDDEDGVAARLHGKRGGGEKQDVALELSSALACLDALVEKLGGFLSPHLSSVLSILLNPRVLACSIAGCDKFAASIRARLPMVVAPRLLLPSLYDRFEPCLDLTADADGDAAAVAAAPAVALLSMVAAAVAALEPKVAAQYSESTFVFLLRALDVRQRRPSALAAHGDTAIDAVEAAAVGAMVALVMKLSEARFKPLFLRLLEWASTATTPEVPHAKGEPSCTGRMVAMFGVVNALADRLRSVLVPYYRHILNLCVQHLSGAENAEQPRSKKKQRRSTAAVVDEAAITDPAVVTYRDQQVCLTWLLRLRIVRALHRCFIHDSVGFVDAERFARLQDPLVSQLAAEPPDVCVPFLLSSQHADAELSAYVHLGASTSMYTAPDGAASLGPLGAATIGCLLAMAVAANSDALWKPLNHATLMLTRNSLPRVRALALEAVAQLVDRLREEYLVLLPEALPFLSELLEDTDAAVAARVREVVALLEEISGEKLDEYLKV